MKALPTIGQVMELVRQEEKTAAEAQTKQAEAPQYVSEIAKGLHEVANIVKAAAPAVTYDDVLTFGRKLLGEQS